MLLNAPNVLLVLGMIAWGRPIHRVKIALRAIITVKWAPLLVLRVKHVRWVATVKQQRLRILKNVVFVSLDIIPTPKQQILSNIANLVLQEHTIVKKAVILRRTALNVALDLVLITRTPCPMIVTLAGMS